MITNACKEAALDPDSCPCGNCSEPAVRGTCLRYSKDKSGEMRLTGCKPGMTCDDLPRADGDVVIQCACSGRFSWLSWHWLRWVLAAALVLVVLGVAARMRHRSPVPPDLEPPPPPEPLAL